jgi:hypothetical protein
MAFMRGIIAPNDAGRIECRPRLCFQALGAKKAWIGGRAILVVSLDPLVAPLQTVGVFVDN